MSFLLNAMSHHKTTKCYCGRIIFIGLLFVLTTVAHPREYWIAIDSPTTRDLNKLHFLDNQTGWVAGDSGLIMRTSDGGQDWVVQPTNIDNNIYEIFMLNEDYGWALGIQFHTEDIESFGTVILRTSNGGVTWNSYLFPNEYFLAAFFLDSLNGWIGGEGGKLMRTTDGGSSWFPANVDSTVFSNFAIRDFEFFSPQYGYAVGGHIDIAGVIWRTDDGGQFWSVQGVAPEPVLNLHFVDSLHIIAVSGDLDFGSGKVTSTDGGMQWEYTYLGIFGEARAIAFRTPAEAWSPLGFTGTLMVTQDSGKTWTDLYSPDSIPMYDVTFTDSTTGFMVGNQGRILKYNPVTAVIESGSDDYREEAVLFPNYPNPFNTTTTLAYELTARAFVSLQLFDIRGSIVANLENGIRNPGHYETEFNAVDLSSGVYLYRLTTISLDGKNQVSKVSKMILLK